MQPCPANTDISFEHWLLTTPYPEWRKDELRLVYLRLKENHKSLKEISKVKSFMKKETYTEYKYPRGINSRTDEYKCLFGPWIRAIESQIYQLPEFIKHIPVSSRAQYVIDLIDAPGYLFMATDYSQYESHFTKEIMEAIEFEVYSYMTQNIPNKHEFEELLQVLTGENRCHFRDFIIALSATRMSGEMNTSLGNGISNYFLTKFVLHKRGYTLDEIKTVVEGDDGLTRVRPENVPTSEDFKKLGFTIKIEVYDKISDASFCGLVFDPDDRQVITSPIEFLTSFFWMNGQKYGRANTTKLKKLLRAKALSALYQYSGCPIIKSAAAYALRMTTNLLPQFERTCAYDDELRLEIMAKFPTRKSNHSSELIELVERPIGLGSRLLVERLYGIQVNQQIAIENYFSNKTDFKPFRLVGIEDVFNKDMHHYYRTYVTSGGLTQLPFLHVTDYFDLVRVD